MASLSMFDIRFFRAITAPRTPKPLEPERFRDRLHHDIGPVADRPQESGSGRRGRIADQRQDCGLGQIGDGFDAEKALARIAGQLAIEKPVCFVDLQGRLVDVGGIGAPAAFEYRAASISRT